MTTFEESFEEGLKNAKELTQSMDYIESVVREMASDIKRASDNKIICKIVSGESSCSIIFNNLFSLSVNVYPLQQNKIRIFLHKGAVREEIDSLDGVIHPHTLEEELLKIISSAKMGQLFLQIIR